MELESGIEKVQVLKGKARKGKARQVRDKARQGKGKAGKCQRIERRKELNWKEKKRREEKSSSLDCLSFLFFFPFPLDF